MFRKIILGIASLALVAVAFAIYIWREEPGPIASKHDITELRHRPQATQPATGSQPAAFNLQSKGQPIRIPPGQAPKLTVFDPRTGEASIIFRAKQWDPIADNEFDLTEPFARVLLRGGQLAYVRADQGHVKVAGDNTKSLNPKSGWFKGNVEIFIDRSKPQWREEHPEQAAPEQHPDTIVKIWLENARFDMDLARLESDGSVVVQSPQATIEGKGLELAWNAADRQLRMLRLVEGKRAVIRNVGLGEFGSLPGQSPSATGGEGTAEPAGDALQALIQGGAPPAVTSQPATGDIAQTATSAPTGTGEITFLDQDRPPHKLAINTYQVVFRDNVVVRQINGLKTIGSLKANALTLLRDFGREERNDVQYGPGAGGTRRTTTTARAASAPVLRSSESEAGSESASVRTASAPVRHSPEGEAGNESVIEIVWTGEVLVEAITPPTSQEAAAKGKRTHLKAVGNPVQMVDEKQGRVTCRTFEYHMETKQGWLTGSPQEPVVMNTGPDRQIVVDQTLFFDQKNGEARITGPGKMIGSRREQATPEPAAPPMLSAADRIPDTSSEMQVAWQESGQIGFDQMQADRAKQGTTPDKRRAYLKSAHFTGKVVAGVVDQSIAADKLDVSFLPPPPKAASEQAKTRSPLMSGDLLGGTTADHITAMGHVRMTQKTLGQSKEERRRQQHRNVTETVVCDRLEIDMALDDTGRPYPRVGKAIGHVLARQSVQPYMGTYKVGSPLVRDIRADDEIAIEMASIPNPLTDGDIQRLLGLTPDSQQWKDKEHKPRIIRRQLTARGNVSATDTQRKLDGLQANTLDCTFDTDQKISKALLVGTADAPAHVEQDTFYIRGERLSLDMTKETVDVPGKGMLRFYSDQDIDGRPVEEKVPIVVTWQREMWLRGSENLGLFQGDVRVTSENNVMEARELRLRFTPVAKATAAATDTRPANEWIIGPLVDLTRSRAKDRDTAGLAPQRERRLSRADAFGDVVIVSSSYRPANETLTGRLDRFITDRTPRFLRHPATRPAEPDKTFLLSRIRLTGPQVRIDLTEMQLLVEGAGTLLVEDYRIPAAGGRSRAEASDALLSASVVPGVDNLGPSQTFFQWENSMSFLSRDNLAAFDRNVQMRHQAGTAMAMYDKLEAALKLDPAVRKRLVSRSAALTCDNLVAQFETAKSAGAKAGPSPLSKATGLKAFWARRNVRLVDREARVQRSADGSLLYYEGQSGDAKITGTDQTPAWIESIDPKTGRPIVNWRGREVTWNVKTGEIRTEKSQILAPGR